MSKYTFQPCHEKFKTDFPGLTIVAAAEYKEGYLISAKDGPDGSPYLYRVEAGDLFASPFSPTSDMRGVNDAFSKHLVDIKRLT